MQCELPSHMYMYWYVRLPARGRPESKKIRVGTPEVCLPALLEHWLGQRAPSDREGACGCYGGAGRGRELTGKLTGATAEVSRQ